MHAELLADLLWSLGGLLVLRRAAGRGDLETGERGELATDFVGDPVREVLVLRAAQVFEGKHGKALDAAGLGRVTAAVVLAEPADQHAQADEQPDHERRRGL